MPTLETRHEKTAKPQKPKELWGLWSADDQDWIRSNDYTGAAILAFETRDEAADAIRYAFLDAVAEKLA